MIALTEIQKIARAYKPEKVHKGVLGSHSALALGMAAKAFGAKTLLVAEKGREEIYTRDHRHLYDHVVLVNKFKDILSPEVMTELLEYNTVWVPHRSFTVYVGIDGIENDFGIPIYGSRMMLRSEDRNA
jgi:5-formaminoimidazole-4-carboxamide-1-(beta)-D-ribofuranosyl 5'-monophosphate synthetase